MSSVTLPVGPHYFYDSKTESFLPFQASHSSDTSQSDDLPLYSVHAKSPTSQKALSSKQKQQKTKQLDQDELSERPPRPQNAFMIFRSEFLAKKKIERSIEWDHRLLSRIVGHCWNSMSDDAKRPYKLKAEQEKLAHLIKYPNYRFAPATRRKTKPVKRNVKRKDPTSMERCKKLANLVLSGKEGEELKKLADELDTSQPSGFTTFTTENVSAYPPLATLSVGGGGYLSTDQLKVSLAGPVYNNHLYSNYGPIEDYPRTESLFPSIDVPVSLANHSNPDAHGGVHHETIHETYSYQRFPEYNPYTLSNTSRGYPYAVNQQISASQDGSFLNQTQVTNVAYQPYASLPTPASAVGHQSMTSQTHYSSESPPHSLHSVEGCPPQPDQIPPFPQFASANGSVLPMDYTLPFPIHGPRLAMHGVPFLSGHLEGFPNDHAYRAREHGQYEYVDFHQET